MVLIMAGFALAGFGGGCIGWVLKEWRYAEQSRLWNDSVREGTRRVYSQIRDGRNADRYAEGRYAEGNH